MNFLNWFTLISGVAGLFFAFYAYFEARKQERALAYTAGAIAALLLITAFFSTIIPLTPHNTASSGSNRPTTQRGITSTPVNTISPTAESTPTPTDTLIPIPSATPTPTPFTYVADWSHGPNGWAVNDVWRVYGGALHSSGTGEIPFPFQLNPSSSGTTDYTVEWKSTAIDNSGGFGVSVRAGNDGSTYGYHISFNDQDINQDVWVDIFDGPGHIYGDHRKLFTVGPGEHDFIVSVKANLITIKVDGSQVMQVQDNTFPIGGSSSFFAGGQVNITYLKVTQQ